MDLIHIDNEYTKLLKIALYKPSMQEIYQGPPSRAMYLDRPDPNKVLREFDGIVERFLKLNIEVVVLIPDQNSAVTTNMIYLRDVAFVGGNEVYLANMKHTLREYEPPKFKQLLSVYNPSYKKHLRTVPRQYSLEGADLMHYEQKSLIAYTGSRTNHKAANFIKNKLNTKDYHDVKANISGVPQHLLGGLHIVDRQTATRRTQYCPYSVDHLKFIDFVENEEVSKGFSLNIVTVGPNEVLMPKNRPKTKYTLEQNNVLCHEVEIDEIHKMGGGLACMTLPLTRRAL